MFEDFVWEPLFWHGVSSFLKAIGKTKRLPGPYLAQEGVLMFGAPSIVPLVGCRALIAPVSYV